MSVTDVPTDTISMVDSALKFLKLVVNLTMTITLAPHVIRDTILIGTMSVKKLTSCVKPVIREEIASLASETID